MSDPVNHPAHYTAHPSGVECIDVVEHMTFNVGNAIKYCWRAGLKLHSASTEQSRLTDLKKAEWYIRREIVRLTHGDAATIHGGPPVFTCTCACGCSYPSHIGAELNPSPRPVSTEHCPECGSDTRLTAVTTLAGKGHLAKRRDVATGTRFYDFYDGAELVCKHASGVNLHIHEQLILSSGTGFGDLPVLVLEGGANG